MAELQAYIITTELGERLASCRNPNLAACSSGATANPNDNLSIAFNFALLYYIDQPIRV